MQFRPTKRQRPLDIGAACFGGPTSRSSSWEPSTRASPVPLADTRVAGRTVRTATLGELGEELRSCQQREGRSDRRLTANAPSIRRPIWSVGGSASAYTETGVLETPKTSWNEQGAVSWVSVGDEKQCPLRRGPHLEPAAGTRFNVQPASGDGVRELGRAGVLDRKFSWSSQR